MQRNYVILKLSVNANIKISVNIKLQTYRRFCEYFDVLLDSMICTDPDQKCKSSLYFPQELCMCVLSGRFYVGWWLRIKR